MQADNIGLKERPSLVPMESPVGFIGLATHGAYNLQAHFFRPQSQELWGFKPLMGTSNKVVLGLPAQSLSDRECSTSDQI